LIKEGRHFLPFCARIHYFLNVLKPILLTQKIHFDPDSESQHMCRTGKKTCIKKYGYTGQAQICRGDGLLHAWSYRPYGCGRASSKIGCNSLLLHKQASRQDSKAPKK
jgi:hypothetical protein